MNGNPYLRWAALFIAIMYSCSKITLAGFYTLDKAYDRSQIAEPPDEEYLQLKQDSTFTYEVFQSHYYGEDVVAEYFSFIGEGKYTVKKDTLTLNFYTNYKPRLLPDLNLDSRFIRPRYKIDEYPITGTLTFPISKFKDTIKLGALIKNR